MNVHNMMNQNWTVRRSIPSMGKLFLYPKATWPVLGPTQLSVAWVSRVLPAGSSSQLEADHWSPSSAEVKSKWCYTSTPPICLRDMYRDNYFTINQNKLVLKQ